MICDKCKKRAAVVFIAEGTGQTKGYCLTCAKKLGIKPANDFIGKLGLDDKQLEEIEDMNTEFMNSMSPDDANAMFELGGAQTFPLGEMFSKNAMMPTAEASGNDASETVKKEKRDQKSAQQKQPKRKYLNSYCVDLTKKARDGQIDRIIGRDKEIYRVIQILNRRTKNNPCLIGEPGVGKTAIAEGIAQKIVSNDVPGRLSDKEVFLLDLTALVAGTQFRGQFESRVKGLVDEVKACGNIILFIDEVHNLVGTGDSEGTMNAANILKPALSRGEIQVIGATTFNEYRKYIEKDAALERRFQPVTVNEPSVEDTVEVLKGIKDYYENHHRVKVSDAIVRRATVLSERYITDRFLPDKAIDLLDEACSCASLKNKYLDEYDKISRELTELNNQIDEMEAKPETLDYEQAAKLRASELQLQQKQKDLEPLALNVAVTDDDLAKVIELWTGIPASKIKETELRRVAKLDEALKKRIIGQDEAVELVAAAVRRTRVQISPKRRPASFIFVGPTGVGKTELVKVLSEELFDTADPLIRLDMSEFMEKHSVSRIVGSPPGYVGYDEAGQLTEKVRRKPYSVILFDEIEKAHPDVMNILLQILDEGRITDAHGRTVSFENTVIVMTSNAGSQIKEGTVGFNKQANKVIKDKVMKALSEFLRPEFLGRVDEVVVFRNLDEKDYASIAALLLDELKQSLEERDIKFGYEQSALDLIASKSFGKQSGARDIYRIIRKEVEDKLCGLLLDDDEQHNLSIIKLTAEDGELKLLAV